MKYEKKLVILAGINCDNKGSATVERSAYGVRGQINLFNLPRIVNSEFLLIIKDTKIAPQIVKLGNGDRVATSFQIDDNTDLSLLHLVVGVKAQGKIVPLMYGTNDKTRLWQGNMLDGVDQDNKELIYEKKNNEKREEKNISSEKQAVSLVESGGLYSSRPKRIENESRRLEHDKPNSIENFFYDILPCDYADSEIASINFYPKHLSEDMPNENSTTEDTPVSKREVTTNSNCKEPLTPKRENRNMEFGDEHRTAPAVFQQNYLKNMVKLVTNNIDMQDNIIPNNSRQDNVIPVTKDTGNSEKTQDTMSCREETLSSRRGEYIRGVLGRDSFHGTRSLRGMDILSEGRLVKDKVAKGAEQEVAMTEATSASQLIAQNQCGSNSNNRQFQPRNQQQQQPRNQPRQSQSQQCNQSQPQPRNQQQQQPCNQQQQQPRNQQQSRNPQQQPRNPQPQYNQQPRNQQPSAKVWSNSPPQVDINSIAQSSQGKVIPPPSYYKAAAINDQPTSAKPKAARFYDTVKEQIKELFEKYPPETKLIELMPGTKWVRVDFDDRGKYYVVGVIGDKPDYICYGVPARYTAVAPKELDGYCQWLPIDSNKPQEEGFWLMYQDAVSGESVSQL